jgi:hypothetical protein
VTLDVAIPPNPKKTGDTHKGKKKKFKKSPSDAAYGECTIQRLFTCQWFFQHLPTSEHIERPGRWPCCGASKPEVRWQCCEC